MKNTKANKSPSQNTDSTCSNNNLSNNRNDTNSTKHKFFDLFPIEKIQAIQDAFSDATGVASIITDVDGTPLTKPSNFSHFCNGVIRKTEKGLKNCMYSDSIIGSPKKSGPRLQKCLSGGLYDGGASIMIGDEHIANWLIGQVLESNYNEADMLLYAKEIGANEDEYLDALSKVTRMDKEQFENTCNFLFIVANQLSALAAINIKQTNEIRKRKLIENQLQNLNDQLEEKVLLRTNQLRQTNLSLEETNVILKAEIAEREEAEQIILNLNNTLEQKVIDRTNELQEINTALKQEIVKTHKTEVKLKSSQEIYRLVVENISDVISVYNIAQKKFTYFSSSIYQLSGFTVEEAMNQDLEASLTPDSYIKLRKFLKEHTAEFINNPTHIPAHTVEIQYICKNGNTIWVEISIKFSYNKNNEIECISVSRNIDERKKTEQEILYLSYYDPLTSVYNRRFYTEELKRLNVQRNLPLTLILGDVNGLKLINDSFGHSVGDELLKKVSEVIKKGCRTDDIIARIGGDEFTILLPNTTSLEAEEIIKRISEIASTETIHNLDISISFGWETKHTIDEKIEDIFRKAENYMYKKKLFEGPSMKSKAINAIFNTLHEKNKREEAHADRVSLLCEKMGHALNLLDWEIKELKTVGLMHDIGKIAIPESILNKPYNLTNEEWISIKSHPDIGYRILITLNEMSDIANYILYHHERFDGKGYPKGISGNSIPFVSRILTIADSFDAMTSDRSYRTAMTKEYAIAQLQKNSGTQFDPELVDVFITKVL